MGINNNLDNHRESTEFKMPDGEILRLYESLYDDQKEIFASYVKEKLQRDPWSQDIIEEQICTNTKALQLIDLGNRERKLKWLAWMKAANDENYSAAA